MTDDAKGTDYSIALLHWYLIYIYHTSTSTMYSSDFRHPSGVSPSLSCIYLADDQQFQVRPIISNESFHYVLETSGMSRNPEYVYPFAYSI